MLPTLATMAARNLFQHRRRTLLVGLPVLLGAAFVVTNNGLITGLGRQLVQNVVLAQLGHLTITAAPPEAEEPLSGPGALVSAPEPVAAALRQRWPEAAVSFALSSPGMILFEEASSSRIAVLGIQPQQDHLLLQGLRQRALGALGELGPGCVYLSRRLRDRLGAALGDWITLSVPTASGALAAADFRVVGILGRGAPWQDYFIYVPLGDLQHLLGLGEAVQQIKVTFPEPKQPLSALRAQAEQLLPPASRLRVQTYRESGSFFLGILTANRVLLESMNLILLFAVALGVAGTQLLSVNERRREIGTMLALGTSRAQVAGVFLLEGAFLALAFGLLGAWAGAGVTAYLARHGLGIPIEAFTWMTGTDRLFPRLSWAAFPAALGELVLVTALAGLYPALQAARLEPTRALHGGEQ